MRRGQRLARRPAAARTAKPATRSSDTGGDPPIVARLVQPLLALRASLGTGVSIPNASIVSALKSSSTQAADTEAPHRDGMQALESTWSGPGADAAVPALRTTQTQIGDISDRGPAYLAVLSDAQATSSRAAHKVDGIISDFRRDSRTILNNATAAPDTDAVINRATQALREAITAVNTAKTEMAAHTLKLNGMGPLTVTTPANLSSQYSGNFTPTYSSSDTSDNSSNAMPSYSSDNTSNYTPYNNGMSFNNGTPYNNTSPVQYLTGAGAQLDPAAAAQLQLQEQLISAGVDVGSAAVSAGVNIASELIDKIAEVGTHTVDTVATVAEQAIPQLINPSASTNGGASGPAANATPSLFNFGGSSPSTQAPSGGSGTIIPPTPGPTDAPSAPAPAGNSTPPGADSPAPPAPKPVPPPAAPPAPAPQAPPPAPSQSGPAAGLALPPTPGSGTGDPKPRDGQLGVTSPAAVQMVPTAVIGDFGDDEF